VLGGHWGVGCEGKRGDGISLKKGCGVCFAGELCRGSGQGKCCEGLKEGMWQDGETRSSLSIRRGSGGGDVKLKEKEKGILVKGGTS